MEVFAIGLVVLLFAVLGLLAWRSRAGQQWYQVNPSKHRFVGDNVYELLIQLQLKEGSTVWVQSWVPVDAGTFESYDSFGLPIWIRGNATDGVELIAAYKP